MFYKKNGTDSLSAELFQNPTSEYRGAPFWSWNCKVTKDLIKDQIEIYKQMGMGGFHVHARTGLETPYMSDEYLDLVKYADDLAKENQMLCYLYDEDRYPSGAAGGLVTEDVRLRQRFLFLSRKLQDEMCDSKEEFERQIDEGKKPKGYYITSYEVILKDGYLTSYKRVSKDTVASEDENGKIWHCYLKLAKESPWFNDQTYIDVLNKKAVERFIEVTHERYYKELGEEFGKSIPSIFTDEPQIAGKFAFPSPDSDKDATVSYTDDMSATYKELYGVELLDVLPEILWELPDGQVSVHRYQYHDHLSERFVSAFCDTIGDWCGKHDIAFTGHFMSERTLYSQTLALSEAMRCYRSFQMPGIDILCDAKELTTAKQAVSVARQYGREAVTSEMYGVTHWDWDFKGHKLQGDWQAALGILVRAHHLTFMSMEGESKRDWPASIGYQSPWYTKYSYVEDHFGRVNTALSRGVPEVKVGVIHPIESYWISYGPNSQTQTVRDQLDENYEKLMQWMLYGTIDFDLISEALLPGLCNKNATKPMCVGKMQYDAILVPDCITIRSTTLERLESFVQAGGKVVFAGRIPQLVDARPSDRAQKLAMKSACVQFNRAEILQALQDVRTVEIRQNNGKLSDNLIYQMRNDTDGKWLFICHVNRKHNRLDKHEKYFIHIKGAWNVTLYNTLNGEITPLKADIKDGDTHLKQHIFAEDSLLLKLEPVSEREIPEKPAYSYVCQSLARPCGFALSEPNVLLLDYAEYAFDDEEWKPKEEILRIDNEFRVKLGLPRRMDAFTQPWRLPDEKPEHVVKLRFTFDSEIEVKDAKLAMERPENASISLNGESVDTASKGWYVDKFITMVDLPLIKAGTNVLEMTIPFARKTNLEWCYILGDFGVNMYGDYAYITTKPEHLVYGDITRQKLPFYTGNVTYKNRFTLTEDKEDVVLEVPHFASPVLEVVLDGQNAGLIAYAPHKLSLGSLKAGEHTVDIIMYGNRFNGFGTLHNANDEFQWYGPDSYRTAGSQWTDSYLVHQNGILSAVNILTSK